MLLVEAVLLVALPATVPAPVHGDTSPRSERNLRNAIFSAIWGSSDGHEQECNKSRTASQARTATDGVADSRD
jgi:hypothetical protein